jgi:ribosomal protein S18 acetylase RimI-like enzyme
METRRATAEDEARLRTLWDASNAEAGDVWASSAFSPDLLDHHTVFVAKVEGEVVGCVYVALPPDAEHAFVFGLYVVPTVRRRGVGKRLMSDAAAHALAESRTYVALSVDTPNSGARVLYDTLGFAEVASTLRIEAAKLAS